MTEELKDKGLIIINTGDGKGKSTAAFGVLFRAVGRGMKVGVVQFIKGKWKTGEGMHAEKLDSVDFFTIGRGFTWDSDDLDKDKEIAKEAWEKSKEFINDDKHEVVILDEITYAMNYNFIETEDVVNTLKNKPEMKHVIMTGRDCPEQIIEIADLVTEMKLIKHPYKKGIKAQIGIEY